MKNISILVCIAFMISSCGGIGQPSSPSGTPETNLAPPISPSPTPHPPYFPRLQVVGNKIVNEDGEIVILRGLGTQQIINLATTDYDIPWDEDLFRTIHDWGATVVRVLVAPVRFFEDEERGLEVLDQAIEWAGKYDMYVIINFNAFGFPPTGFLADSNSVELASNVDTIRFWQAVSARYAGNNTVAFYEIINEQASHPWDGRTYSEDWVILKDFSELVIDLIRENDPETIVIVGGLRWSADLSYVLNNPIQRSNVAYAMHLYPNTADDWDLAFGDVAKRHPVIISDTTFEINITGTYAWLNESNYRGDQPFRFALMDYVDERGLSWVGVVFSSQWDSGLVQNQSFEPNEVGQFFRDQLSSYNRQITTGERIHVDKGVFSNSVGKWESTDPSDGSLRTLGINSVGLDQYKLHYVDNTVSLCTGNRTGLPPSGVEAEGESEAFYQKLDIGPLYLNCSINGWVGGLLFDSFVYDSDSDTLTDIMGTVWSRTSDEAHVSIEIDFKEAVGEWTSIDSSDSSNQTLSVNQLSPEIFTVQYIDEKASICSQDANGLPLFAAEGNGQGEPFGQTLQLSLNFVCIGDPNGTTATYSIEIRYDPLADVITDSFSNQWTRAD